jgi:hypothetical protein
MITTCFSLAEACQTARPREFVERELSDKVCFNRLLKAFNLDI